MGDASLEVTFELGSENQVGILILERKKIWARDKEHSRRRREQVGGKCTEHPLLSRKTEISHGATKP